MIALDLSLSTVRPSLASVLPALIGAINADGWSAEWANGTPPTFVPDTAPQTIGVLRAGFDATGGVTNHIGTRTLTRRRRNLFPAQTSDNAASVALDDYVYASDVVAGAVNNSTETSPKPVAAWVMPGRLLVGNAVHWEIVAFHRNFRSNRQVACVRVRANDGATQTAWQIVAATTRSTLAEDANPIEAYVGDLDISALATGLFWLEAEVLPWIGTATSILRSEDQTAEREFSRRYFLKNAARAASPPLAYVASTGSDSTAAWSVTASTAAATPFLTVAGALAAIADTTRGTPATGGIADGGRIRIVDTVALGTSSTSRPQNVAAVVVERAPGTARGAAIATLGAAFRPRLGVGTLTAPLTEGAILFQDVTISRSAAAATFSGEAATPLQVRFWNVTFANGGTTSAILANAHAYWFGVAFTGFNGNLGGTNEHRLMRGLTVDAANIGAIQHWVIVGSTITRAATPAFLTPTRGALWYANKFLNPSATTSPIQIDGTAPGDTITGIVVVQNLIEVTHTTDSSPAFRISSDNGNAHTVHTIIAHNTITGYAGAGRANVFYDESTTDAVRRAHRLIRDVGNIHVQLNTKGDVWVGTNQQRTTEAPNRGGQLAYAHGVGCQGNWSQYHPASAVFSNEEQAYPGLGSRIGAQATSPQAMPAAIWASYQGTTGSGGTPVAGAGGGNYALAAGSPVRGLVSVRGLTLDLAGAARPTSGNDAAGAYC